MPAKIPQGGGASQTPGYVSADASEQRVIAETKKKQQQQYDKAIQAMRMEFSTAPDITGTLPSGQTVTVNPTQEIIRGLNKSDVNKITEQVLVNIALDRMETDRSEVMRRSLSVTGQYPVSPETQYVSQREKTQFGPTGVAAANARDAQAEATKGTYYRLPSGVVGPRAQPLPEEVVNNYDITRNLGDASSFVGVQKLQNDYENNSFLIQNFPTVKQAQLDAGLSNQEIRDTTNFTVALNAVGVMAASKTDERRMSLLNSMSDAQQALVIDIINQVQKDWETANQNNDEEGKSGVASLLNLASTGFGYVDKFLMWWNEQSQHVVRAVTQLPNENVKTFADAWNMTDQNDYNNAGIDWARKKFGNDPVDLILEFRDAQKSGSEDIVGQLLDKYKDDPNKLNMLDSLLNGWDYNQELLDLATYIDTQSMGDTGNLFTWGVVNMAHSDWLQAGENGKKTYKTPTGDEMQQRYFDIANTMGYTIGRNTLSAASTIVFDPTIVLGKVRGLYLVTRYGVGKLAIENGFSAGTNMARLMEKPAINRYFSYLGKQLDKISKAPVEKHAEMLNSLAAQEKKYFNDQSLIMMLKFGARKPEDFVRFFDDGQNVEHILKGQAARRHDQRVIPHAMRHTILSKELSFKARGLTWSKNLPQIIDRVLGPGTTTALNNTIDGLVQEEAAASIAQGADEAAVRATYAKRRAEIWDEVNKKLSAAFEDDKEARKKAEFVSQFLMADGVAQHTWLRRFITGEFKFSPWHMDITSPNYLAAFNSGKIGAERAGAIASRYGFKKKGGFRARAERVSRTMAHMPNNSEPYHYYDGPGMSSSAKRIRDILLFAGVDRGWSNFVRTAWLYGTPAQRRNIAEGVIKTFVYASGIHILDPDNVEDFTRGLVGALDDTQVFSANLFDENALAQLAKKISSNEKYTPGKGGAGIVEVAANGKTQYRQTYGINGSQEVDYRHVKVDQVEADRIAAAYDELPTFDPKAKPYYDAMIAETEQQYRFMTENLGIKVEFVDSDPYKTSAEMMRDVAENNRLKVYRTQGDQAHPYMTNEQNDLFRAVHDFFGHAGTGMQFGPIGEEAAWIAHSSMYSPMAQRALTTETRGQNSWVNQTAHRSMPAPNRPFAEQKFALLPEEFSRIPVIISPPARSSGEIAAILKNEIRSGVHVTPELRDELSAIMKNPSRYLDENGRQKSSAIYLGQTSTALSMPDFTRLADFGMRSSTLQALLGNNAGVQKLTDYWVAGTLLGPRFQLRSGIEDMIFHALTGGSWRGYYKGLKYNRSLREARGQKRGLFQTITQSLLGTALSKDLVMSVREAERAGDYAKTMQVTKIAMYRFRLSLSPFKRDRKLADPSNPYNLTPRGLREQGYLDDLTLYGGNDAMQAIGNVQETGANLITALEPGSVRQGLDVQRRLHPRAESISGAIATGKGSRTGYEGHRVGQYKSQPWTEGTHSYEDWYQGLFFAAATDGPKGKQSIVLIDQYYAAKKANDTAKINQIVGELGQVIAANDGEYKYTKYLVHGEREGVDGLAQRTLDATLTLFQNMDGSFNSKLYNTLVKTENGIKRVDLKDVSVKTLENIGRNGNVPEFVYGRSGFTLFMPKNAIGVNWAWDATGRSLGRLTRTPIYVSNYIDSRNMLAPFEAQMAKQFGEVSAKRWATKIALEDAYESTMIWVDNPNIRSQLAWNMRNVARFYRAAEDFNRRMLRIVKNQPMAVWKAALTWNILDDSGFTHTDENGDKYIIWPMLTPVFGMMNFMTSRLFNTPMMNIDSSIGFSSKATMFTPSADPNAWFPTFSGPYAALALKPIMRQLPLLSSMEDEFFGEYSKGQAYWRGVIPPTAQRIIDLWMADSSGSGATLQQKFESQTDSPFATAARQAMQIYYNTLDFDPTEGFKLTESEDAARSAIDRIAMDLLLFKVLTGNFLPAATNSFVNNTTEFAKDFGYKNLNTAFVESIKKYNGDREKALVTWYKTNPELSIWTLSTATVDKSIGYWQAGPEAVKFVEKYSQYIGPKADQDKRLTFGFSMFAPVEQTYGTRAQNNYLESMGLKPNKSVEKSFNELWTAQGYSNYIYLMSEADKILVSQGKDAADAFRATAKKMLKAEYPDLDTRLGGVGTSVTDSEQALNSIREAGKILVQDPQFKEQAELFLTTIDTYYSLKNTIANSQNPTEEATKVRKGWNAAVLSEASSNPDNKKYLELLDIVSTALGSDERVSR